MAPSMTTHRTSALLVALGPILLAGCAKDSGLYPSLSIRDEERISGVFEPVQSEPYAATPPSGEVLEQVAALRASAAAAHRQVLVAAESARAPLANARGSQIGGEEWSIASLALADVQARRSETMVALAELDRLYVAAQTEGGEPDAIVAALSEVNTLVLEEDRLVAGLRAQLP